MLYCERGAGIGVEVDVVNLVAFVVVAGEDDAANKSLLRVGVEVVLALFVEIYQEVAMRDIAVKHDAILVLRQGSHVARTRLQLVLGNHVAVARIVVVPVHLAHLERVYDEVEEDFIKLRDYPVL